MRSFQWFPGHMAKAKRNLKRYLEFSDVIVHTIDARAPQSTFFREIVPRHSKLILVFTKADLADPHQTKVWKQWFSDHGYSVVASPQLLLSQGLKPTPGIRENRRVPHHAIIAGLPNTGKSTLINKLIGRKKAKTGALPGITRGMQWIKLNESVYFLDTPGIFFPENLPVEKAWRLASLGTIPRKSLLHHAVEVCKNLVEYVDQHYSVFKQESANFNNFLESLGQKWGILLKGGEVNFEAVALHLIEDFQKGKWGKITLESPSASD